MGTDVSLDDFTTESAAPPPVTETPSADTSTEHSAPVDTPPVELPEPDPDSEPKTDDEAARRAPSERHPDGTFKAKGKKDPQARIDHVTWEREEARREAAALREERDRLTRELQTRTAPATAPKPAPVQTDPSDPEPKEADFEEYGLFVKAQARWEARQEFRQQQTAFQARQQQDARQQFHGQQTDQFRGRLGSTPDEVQASIAGIHPAVLQLKPSHLLAEGERLTGMNVVADALLDSEHPAALMRYWTDHFDDFRRLLTLHPIQIVREVGKHEARVDTAPAGSVSSSPVLSQAKPPIRPVGSAPSTSDEPPGDDGSFDDHAKYYNAKEHVALPKRRR